MPFGSTALIARTWRCGWTDWRRRDSCHGARSRSVGPCSRAALADAAEEGTDPPQPGGAGPMPRDVAKPPKVKDVRRGPRTRSNDSSPSSPGTAGRSPSVWVSCTACDGHEALALKWDDVNTTKGTMRIDEGLVAASKGAVWSQAKNERSRRMIPLDDESMRALGRRRKDQAEERLLAGARWEDHNLIKPRTSGGRSPSESGPGARAPRRGGPSPPARPPTVSVTRQPPTWCAARTMSASSAPSPMSSGTAPTCSCGSTPTPCRRAPAPSPIGSDNGPDRGRSRGDPSPGGRPPSLEPTRNLALTMFQSCYGVFRSFVRR